MGCLWALIYILGALLVCFLLVCAGYQAGLMLGVTN